MFNSMQYVLANNVSTYMPSINYLQICKHLKENRNVFYNFILYIYMCVCIVVVSNIIN